jgi:CHAD domain-containing protein
VATEDELKELSESYGKVVDNGILKQAQALPPALPPAERRDLLNALAAKLRETGLEAERIAQESPPQARRSLEQIADTARKGQNTLRDLARREG